VAGAADFDTADFFRGFAGRQSMPMKKLLPLISSPVSQDGSCQMTP
jgi:hypothetical protein